MRKIGFIILALFVFSINAQELSQEQKKHWTASKVYEEEKMYFDAALELEKLLAIGIYEPAYIKIIELYNQSNTKDAILSAKYYLDSYVRFYPEVAKKMDDMYVKLEVKRKIWENKFWKKMEGRWAINPSKFGDNLLDFEVKSLGRGKYQLRVLEYTDENMWSLQDAEFIYYKKDKYGIRKTTPEDAEYMTIGAEGFGNMVVSSLEGYKYYIDVKIPYDDTAFDDKGNLILRARINSGSTNFLEFKYYTLRKIESQD